MPRTLVTGATGFIGSHVARLLVARGDEVHVTVRPGSSMEGLAGLQVATIEADILDRRSMRRALAGMDGLFHLAGSTDLRAPRAQMLAVGVEGVRIVLEEALRARVSRAVYTSSVAAVGPAEGRAAADERSRWQAGRYGIPYLDAAHEAETIALGLVARGLPLVIVNPAHVLGPGDPGRSSTTLVQRFLSRQIPAYVNGTLNVVGVQDVARGHLLADENGQVGERYILGNRNFTLDRLFADLGRLSGVAPPAVKLPVTVALTLAAAGQRVGGLGLPAPVEVRAASLDWRFSSRRARQELGWSTAPHEDCLEETIAWYRSQPAFGEREPAPPGADQPWPLRAAGGMLRRVGL